MGHPDRGRAVRDLGSAPVEFVLVAPLVLLLGFGVIQVLLAVHLRSVAVLAATAGARVAAAADGNSALGVARTRSLLADQVSRDRIGAVSSRTVWCGGQPFAEVVVSVRIAPAGLLGGQTVTVRGHSVMEAW